MQNYRNNSMNYNNYRPMPVAPCTVEAVKKTAWKICLLQWLMSLGKHGETSMMQKKPCVKEPFSKNSTYHSVE